MEPDEKEVLVTYAAGHTSKEKWTKAKYYCPNCAQVSVWNGDGDDYYAGAQFICTNCSRSFYFYQEPIFIRDASDESRLKQLKASVAAP